MIRKADREEFMRRLAAEHPNPKSELHFSTPFELLIAVVLSAQATDKDEPQEDSLRLPLCYFLFTAFRKALKKIKRSFLLLYPFAFLLFFP